MQILILAGGFGTRLRSEIGESQKALAPINGTPLLKFQIDFWVKAGVKNFIFLLHYKAENVIVFIKDQMDFGSLQGCRVSWHVEHTPLGTGGAIANVAALRNLESEFLVFNADTWVDTSVFQIMQTPGNVIGVIGVSDCSRYGTVEFSNEGFVTKFAEKVSDVRKGWINAGVYKLKRNVFTQRKVEKFSLEEVVFPDLVSRRELTVVPLKGEFCDIGIPSNYYALQSKLLKHRE